MEDVTVLVHFGAPKGRVFDAVSDHETLLRGPGMTTRIVRAGSSERNGLGCLREVHAPGGLRFLEEITAWERPSSFEYVIREASLPARHERGRVSFVARGTGTDVEWTTRFEVPVPIVGGLLGGVARRVFARVFGELLVAARTRLEEPAA
jgi:hypothetical protein